MSVNTNRRKKRELVEKIFSAGARKGLTPRDMLRAMGKHPNYSTQMLNPNLETLEALAQVAGGRIDFVQGTLHDK